MTLCMYVSLNWALSHASLIEGQLRRKGACYQPPEIALDRHGARQRRCPNLAVTDMATTRLRLSLRQSDLIGAEDGPPTPTI